MLKDIKSRVIQLVDLAGYEKNSIVSRTMIDKKIGTVTFFAFDKGQGLSEHTAPFDAMIYVVDGAARIYIAGKPFNLKKGTAIIMPANKPHSVKAIKRFKMILTMVRSL
ncbi:MAG: cupin domain-containing protein [Candidatus Omnitrophota bacterium]